MSGSKKSFQPVNDIESMFYILAYLYKGAKIWKYEENLDHLQQAQQIKQ